MVPNPLYTANGASWNDYVINNGLNRLSASDTACSATTSGPGYNACIHGGEYRIVPVPGETSCAGLTATDSLDAFKWTCDDSTGAAEMISTGLKDGKNLSDLIDFDNAAWLPNYIIVNDGSGDFFASPRTIWWDNSIVVDNDGGTLPFGAGGTIYIVTVDPNATYTFGASNQGLVVQPGVTLTGTVATAETLVAATSKNFLWLEGTLDGNGEDTYGMHLQTVRFSVVRGANINNTSRSGIRVSQWRNNSINNISVANNTTYGIEAVTSFYSSFSDISSSNNGTAGVYLNSSTFNHLNKINGTNNGSRGIMFQFSHSNVLTDITIANNSSLGSDNFSSTNNIFVNVTTAQNNTGLWTTNASGYNSIINVAFVNNRVSGLFFLTGQDNNLMSNLAIAHSGLSYGIYSDGAANNVYTGLLKIGNNGGAVAPGNCFIAGGPDPGLFDITCTNQGPISDATLTTGVSLATTFVGKVTVDDSANASDVNGKVTTFPVDPSTVDWTSFDNRYRGWGNDGNDFPEAGNWQNWTTGTGRIWDWSLKSSDAVIRNVHTVPNGNNTLEHPWLGTAADQVACDALMPGSTFIAANDCRTTYLNHATEILNDDIGNENGLCESNEDCLFTPNIGAYQGHGNLISAGSIGSGGTIENVILWKYDSNGY